MNYQSANWRDWIYERFGDKDKYFIEADEERIEYVIRSTNQETKTRTIFCFIRDDDDDVLYDIYFSGWYDFWPSEVLVSTAHLYHGGIIVEKIVIPVPPTPSGSGGCNIKLLAYCINASKNFSDSEMVFKFGNISNSPQIRNFLKLIEKKKNAYSAFDGSEPTAFSYGEITREI